MSRTYVKQRGASQVDLDMCKLQFGKRFLGQNMYKYIITIKLGCDDGAPLFIITNKILARLFTADVFSPVIASELVVII